MAKLCALRLLREQPEWPPPRMRCITFATPSIGNSALAELVEAAGWAQYFKTYILPGACGGRGAGALHPCSCYQYNDAACWDTVSP